MAMSRAGRPALSLEELTTSGLASGGAPSYVGLMWGRTTLVAAALAVREDAFAVAVAAAAMPSRAVALSQLVRSRAEFTVAGADLTTGAPLEDCFVRVVVLVLDARAVSYLRQLSPDAVLASPSVFCGEDGVPVGLESDDAMAALRDTLADDPAGFARFLAADPVADVGAGVGSNTDLNGEELQDPSPVARQLGASPAPFGPRVSGAAISAPAPALPRAFAAEAARVGLTDAQLSALAAVLRDPPPGLSEDRPFRAGGSGAAASAREALLGARAVGTPSGVLGVGDPVTGSGVATVPPPLVMSAGLNAPQVAADPALPIGASPGSGDLGGDVLSQLLRQNSLLIDRLTRTSAQTPEDRLRSMLSSSEGPSGSSSAPLTGARGCAAREAYIDLLDTAPAEYLREFRRLLARASESSLDALPPAALRTYLERRVPLGSFRALTYMGTLLGHMWEAAESGQGHRVHALIAAGMLFVEQAALDRGRYELAWLFTGLEEPAWHLTTAHTSRQGGQPFSRFAAPRWMAANMAYLRDLDYLESRSREAGGVLHPPLAGPPSTSDPSWSRGPGQGLGRGANRGRGQRGRGRGAGSGGPPAPAVE